MVRIQKVGHTVAPVQLRPTTGHGDGPAKLRVNQVRISRGPTPGVNVQKLDPHVAAERERKFGVPAPKPGVPTRKRRTATAPVKSTGPTAPKARRARNILVKPKKIPAPKPPGRTSIKKPDSSDDESDSSDDESDPEVHSGSSDSSDYSDYDSRFEEEPDYADSSDDSDSEYDDEELEV